MNQLHVPFFNKMCCLLNTFASLIPFHPYFTIQLCIQKLHSKTRSLKTKYIYSTFSHTTFTRSPGWKLCVTCPWTPTFNPLRFGASHPDTTGYLLGLDETQRDMPKRWYLMSWEWERAPISISASKILYLNNSIISISSAKCWVYICQYILFIHFPNTRSCQLKHNQRFMDLLGWKQKNIWLRSFQDQTTQYQPNNSLTWLAFFFFSFSVSLRMTTDSTLGMPHDASQTE